MITYTRDNLYIYEAGLLHIAKSSFISAVEFHETGFIKELFEVAIYMTRKDGSYNCYCYKDVTITDLLNFLNSDSMGKGYNQYIKKGYTCTKLI